MHPLSDPDQILALAYAKADQRPGLTTLFRLDAELGAVLLQNLDPNLANLRLAWWREMLAKGDKAASPLIADALICFPNGEILARLAEGWACLLDDMPLSAAVLDDYARLRGEALFRLGGMPEELAELGKGWALVDFATRCSDRETAECAMEAARGGLDQAKLRAVPKTCRALGVLAYLAHKDTLGGLAKISRKGSPRRALRAIRYVFFG